MRRSSKSRIYLSPPHMMGNERDLLLDAFDSNWIAPIGPHINALEKELAAVAGTEDAVALSSGTAAIHLGLMMLGVKRGDVVLTSTLTFAATANAITYVGAEPVFIDSDRESWNMDPHRLRQELESCARRGRMPKAVITVDLYGQCANYSEIISLCKQHEVPIIEDAAEALGASLDGKPAGSFGEIACFSFNGNKIITGGGGGALVGNSEYCQRARFLSTQARDPAPHYEHSSIGYNYRMGNLTAAVVRGQLQSLEEMVHRRRENFAFYQRELSDLPGIKFMPEYSKSSATRWLTCITVDSEQLGCDSEVIRNSLESENIESRPVWKPMHLQPVFQHLRVRGGDVSKALFENGLCLPSGPNLTEIDMRRVVDCIRSIATSRRRNAA